MDPAQWLADYEETLATAAANAELTGMALRQVHGMARSPRGEVTVRVGASGALEDLRLTPAARAMEVDQLAQLILVTAAAARRFAGGQVVEIMTEYLGEGPGLDFVTQNLPDEAEFAPVGSSSRPDTRDDDDYFANPPEINQ